MVIQSRLTPPDWTDDEGGGEDAARCLRFDISRDPDGVVRNDAWFQDAENAVSIRLHEKHGFEKTGHLRQVGRKFDRWLDLVFMQRFIPGGG